jgi:hypothetical protein
MRIAFRWLHRSVSLIPLIPFLSLFLEICFAFKVTGDIILIVDRLAQIDLDSLAPLAATSSVKILDADSLMPLTHVSEHGTPDKNR